MVVAPCSLIEVSNVSEVLAASMRAMMIALIMEAARTSQTLVNSYLTTRRYNPEDSRLNIFISRSSSVKSYGGKYRLSSGL
jgi:hypothetical protein